MYTDFYKLKAKPFQISSDPRFIWLGEKHKEALATLKYSIIDNKGLMLLTGDVGTGKTTLINTLLESLSHDVSFAFVPDPRLDLLDLLNYIAQAFHIDNGFESKGSFLLHFGWFLESVYKQNKKALLIIDEAQLLTQDLLEEIRLLSNIHRDGNHLLNIFFVGQNEFNEILHRPENRAVTQRITLNYQINPLSLEETRLYINHRLKVAGASRSMFNKSAIEAISFHSEGIPRRINVICDHCLITGYIAEKTVITKQIVEDCIKDITIPRYSKRVPVEKTDDQGQVKLVQENPSSRTGKRTVLIIAALLMLAMIVVTIINPSNPLSQKLVSSYERAAGYISRTFNTTGPSKEEEKVLPMQTDPQPQYPKIDSNTTADNREERAVRDRAQITKYAVKEPGVQAINPPSEPNIRIPGAEYAASNKETLPVEKSTTTETRSGDRQPATPLFSAPLPESSVGDEVDRSGQQREAATIEPAAALQTGPVILRFESNSNEFSTANLDTLITLGLSVKNQPDVMLNISGYTDTAGPAQYNNRLSLIRATMVKSYLLGLGIDSDRMKVQGLGSQNPIADNTTEEGRRLNRRVEIEVVVP